MADYTYATAESRKKLRDEAVNEQTALAAQNANKYANAARAAYAQYQEQANAAYDNAIKAQADAADAQIDKTQAAYNEQFNANEAEAMAQERAVKERMANLGLTQSGYNATQQTAMAASRANADAATRAARQAAVDSIVQSVREYTAQANAEQAQNAANSAYSLNNDILDKQYASGQNALEAANSQYENDIAYQYNIDKQMTADEQALFNLVDSNNNDVYARAIAAYESGNVALGNQILTGLMDVQNGRIVYKNINTSGIASNAQNAFNALNAPKQTTTQTKTDPYPSVYKKRVDGIYDLVKTGDKDSAMKQLNDLLNNDTNDMSYDEIIYIMNYVGISPNEFAEKYG